MRLAVIADIHGNALALEAVLADIARRNPDVIVQLGDACNGPIDPAQVAALLRAHPMVHVRGNGDRMVGVDDGSPVTASARFARSCLNVEDRDWLGSWPATARGDDWFACHGTPDRDTGYLLEEVTRAGVRVREATEIAQTLKGIDCSLILCGHTHLPRMVSLADGRTVVNPGSVGLPAYSDAEPFPHRMEAGSPHARYAIAERTRSGWRVDLLAVDYSWEDAARLAEQSGLQGWSRPLRMGLV